MSFILDALKKSESERQRQAGPALLEMRIIPPARGLPTWAMVTGVVLLASVAVLGWLALRTGPAPANAPPGASMAAPADRVAAGKPQPGAAQAGAQQPGAPQAAAAPAQSPDAGNAPALAAGAAPNAPAASAADTSESGQADDNPADNAPAVAAAPGSQPASESGAKLRSYAELNGTVPELRLDLHVYAPNPADRYAFINMHRVHEGDVTPEGAQVRQITRDGVVLEYRGSEFLLGRQ
jgi:general secretion pathway protein B